MVEKTGGEGEETVEASGDTIVLAEAIGHVGEGLFAIARAIERLAAVESGEDEPQERLSYMDGKRI